MGVGFLAGSKQDVLANPPIHFVPTVVERVYDEDIENSEGEADGH
jgi:hypothetical protein